jgi:hypothetical protein
VRDGKNHRLWRYGKTDVWFARKRGKPFRVHFVITREDRALIHTDKGIGVNSTEKELRAAYPDFSCLGKSKRGDGRADDRMCSSDSLRLFLNGHPTFFDIDASGKVTHVWL